MGALASIKRRWRIAPLPRLLKKAPPVGYLQIPLASPAQIAAWEAELPGRNYAVVPGLSLTFVDVDVRDEKGGQQSLDLLELQYGALPKTFTVRTPSGGLHYYFRGLHTYKIGFRPGLDCPQYVVAPFGVLADGGRYEVIDPSPAAPVPNWLPEVVGLPTDADAAAEQAPAVDLDQPVNIARAIYHLTHDARHSTQGRNGEFALLLTAGELKDMGISKPLAIELLGKHYNVAPFCDPQWNIGDGPTADRLDVKVENAWRYLHQNQPGSEAAEAEFGKEPLPHVSELNKLAAWWKDFDAAWDARHAFTTLHGRRFPVKRPPKAIKTRKTKRVKL